MDDMPAESQAEGSAEPFSTPLLEPDTIIASPLSDKLRMHYQRIGNGSIALLCFHGYGQNEEVFLPLAAHLDLDKVCLITFSLPYHHKESSLGRKQELLPEDFCKFLKIVLRKEKLNKFFACGFSMGARFAVKACCLLPEFSLGAFALSPDGFKPSKWYKLVTQTQLGAALLRYIIFKPSLFQNLLAAATNLRLIPVSLNRFAISQMNTRPKRLKVYLSWMRFREIQFNSSELIACFQVHKIPLVLFAGQYDKIITTKNLQVSVRGLPFVSLKSVPAGHQQMIEKSSTILIQQLKGFLMKSNL